MHSLDLRDPHRQVAAALLATGVAMAVFALFALRRKPLSALEKEQRRRAHLSREGRIVDGTILDATILDASILDASIRDRSILDAAMGEGTGAEAGGSFIFYQYEIAGVMYASSQDVSQLTDYAELDAWIVDSPASIRYDVRNPASSMVVSETWNGLRAGRKAPIGAGGKTPGSGAGAVLASR